MKNKGRKHVHGLKGAWANQIGFLTCITRPERSMSSTGTISKYFGGSSSKKYFKKKWHKRRRGYLKTQHFKDLYYGRTNNS